LYDAGHIKGALGISEAEIGSRVTELPRDKMIITYDSSAVEHISARAVLDLDAKGIKNAAALVGGYNAWVKAGYPTTKR
jgi:rhodanese-related sulfurtransferase